MEINLNEIFENVSASKIVQTEGGRSHKGSRNNIDNVTLENGVRLYLSGYQFPLKGLPLPEVIVAVNQIKKFILATVKIAPNFKLSLFLFILGGKRNLKKSVKYFNNVCYPIITDFIIKDQYQLPFTKEFRKFIFNFLCAIGIEEIESAQTSKIISHIFEYDGGYRFRIQDIFTETTKEKFGSIKEIWRLIKEAEKREIDLHYKASKNYKSKKYKLAGILVIFMLLLYRKEFKIALEKCDFKNLQYDEADTYWALMREDYNHFGKTLEERKVIGESKGYTYP